VILNDLAPFWHIQTFCVRLGLIFLGPSYSIRPITRKFQIHEARFKGIESFHSGIFLNDRSKVPLAATKISRENRFSGRVLSQKTTERPNRHNIERAL